MPDFEFRGPSPGMYPMLRDAFGVPAGTVKPGDILRFDDAPDADWVPYEAGEDSGEDRDPDAGSEQDTDQAGEPGSEES